MRYININNENKIKVRFSETKIEITIYIEIRKFNQKLIFHQI